MSRSRFTVVGLLQPPDPPALVASLTCRICNAAATQSTTDEGDRPDQGIEKEMAEHEVLLYIYDLSQGMAASMSMQLCGKFIPGAPQACRREIPRVLLFSFLWALTMHPFSDAQQAYGELKNSIRSKALGIFLWLTLVWDWPAQAHRGDDSRLWR